MNAKQRTARLLELMQDHRVKCPAVGRMLGVSAQTVRVWRCTDETRAISTNNLELLELKLVQEAQEQQTEPAAATI